MPNNERLGAAFDIDVTNLKAGLAQANRLIRESESEFKAAAAGMDDWSKSEEGLSAKIKSLNSITEVQRKKVDALQEEYDRLVNEGLDPASREAVELRTKINNETAALSKNEAELSKQTKALAELEDASDAAGDAVEKTGDAAKEAGDGFTIGKGAIAGFIANGLSSLVGACKDAISTVFGLAESTREYRTELAKIQTAAGTAGVSTDYIKDKWHDMAAVLGDEGAIGEGLNNIMAAGFTTNDAIDEVAKHLEGAAIKFKDTLKFEGLSDGLQETLATGKAVGPFSELLERSGVNLETFDEGLAKCKTSAEQQNYVLQQLSKLGLADVSASYREQNGDIIAANKETLAYTDTQAKLGEIIEPLTTKFTQLKTQGLQWLIDTGLPALKTGWGWIKDNIPTITTVMGGLTAAWLAFGGAQKIVDGWNKLVAISQTALNAVMNANPIGLIILAITALVAAFVTLWNNCEAFRNFWIGLWDNIKVAAQAVADWFVNAWSSVGTFFTDLWAGLQNAVFSVIEWIKENWQTLLLFITNPIAGVFKYLYDNFEGFRNTVNNVVSSVKKFFSDMWTGFTNGAKKAWSGVKDTFSKVASFFGDVFGKAWQKVKDVFSVGGKIFDGIKDGIITTFKTVVNAIIRGINKIVKLPFEGLNKILSKLQDISVAGVSPFSWLSWRAPVPQLPELATGGVVNRATAAIIGEDGAEAVMPLEKNTGWIKALAKEIAAEQGQGLVIHQTNNYKQAYESPIEKYKSRQQLFAVARQIKAGAF